ncbi:MAG: uracil-DNA glycosylase family protein [Clostridia bacterium]|nr:uracil-DNA glycosylase family protein [Clostridia bacterium]
MNILKKCEKCNLYKNQLPLIDNELRGDIMWVGLSAKQVVNVDKSIPLENNTNSGKILEIIEKRLPHLKFYKTNLVKCLPLNMSNQLRYPTTDEMFCCFHNLIYEINKIKPKIIFLLGKKVYDFVCKNIEGKGFDYANLFYVEHPSYIYVYKRKRINDYVDKIVNICKINL